MKTNVFRLLVLLFSTAVYAQAGHIMQGVGAVNMSMGGAATGQPIDISGALQWNPAAISVFDENSIKFDIGLFFSSPELYGELPAGMLGPGAPGVSGITKDDRGTSFLPNIAYVWSQPESKSTFGLSAFGISGFGVTFPEEANNPLSSSFNPTVSSNPINYPQAAMGFGRVESDYMLLQVGFTWAYELSERFSIGLQPNINYGALELMPNPTGSPTAAGYPSTDGKASAIGFGGQLGLFYDSGSGFKAGVSYKTTQSFGDFEFDNVYLDASKGKNEFNMDYPAILSFGLGFSGGDFDLALDYRTVYYEDTDGFSTTGWTSMGTVAGFGWENINILSAGIQYKGIDKLPIRLGYTNSTNPIPDELTFFNVPATAIIKNAYQFGLSYEFDSNWRVDGVFHYGDSDGKTTGQILNPMLVDPSSNPLGAIPGSEVSYDMTTSMVMFGISYTFDNKNDSDE